ncbi:hypothetical protein SMQE32_33620 [Serratia marcescens]|nr:hypothetical protein SMQE32_33620 [Serratia marcescens]
MHDNMREVKDFIVSFDETRVEDDLLFGCFLFDRSNYSKCLSFCEEGILECVYNVVGRPDLTQEFTSLESLNPAFFLKGFKIEVCLNLSKLRQYHDIWVFKDLNDAISLSPLAKDVFIILDFIGNESKITLCPEEYYKNEVLHYIQIRDVWNLLVSYSDDSDGNSCTFFGARKTYLKLQYTIDDLSKDFDGLSRFKKILTEENHNGEKRNILANTIAAFTVTENPNKRFCNIIDRFSAFTESFEENYHAFAVSFSFDKIRKEYEERFREYLSKINSVLSDSLTRSLAIPASTVLTFSTLKGGGESGFNDFLINISTLLVATFVLFVTYYMVRFQLRIVTVTKKEFCALYDRFESELSGLNLKDARSNLADLNYQSLMLYRLLKFILFMAVANFVINIFVFGCLFLK